MIEFNWTPDWHWLLPLLIVAVGLWLWSYRTARGTAGQPWRLVLLGVRVLVLAALIVCLLDPQRVTQDKHFEPGHVAVLLDTSRSMGWADRGATRLDLAKEWVKQQLKVPDGSVVNCYGPGQRG
jgi:hypothetical protein